MDRRNRAALGVIAIVVIGAPVAIALGQGDDQAGSDPPNLADAPKAERIAQHEELLRSATRASEADGDPTTIEVVYPDGSKGVVGVSTVTPEKFKDLSTEELADMLYGEAP